MLVEGGAGAVCARYIARSPAGGPAVEAMPCWALYRSAGLAGEVSPARFEFPPMALSGHHAADEDDHIVGAAECMRLAKKIVGLLCLLMMLMMTLATATSILVQCGLVRSAVPGPAVHLRAYLSQAFSALPGPDIQSILGVGAASPVGGWVGPFGGLLARGSVRVVFILPAAVAVKHLFFAPRPDTTVTGHVAVVAQFMRRAEEQHDLLSAEHDRLLAAAASPPAPTGVWPDTQWAAQWRRVDEVYREQTTTLNSTTSFGEGELEQAARALMSANNDWSLRLNILGSALYDSPPPGGRWTADLIDKIFKTRRRYELGHDGIPVPALVAAATEAASDAQAARLGSCGPSPLPLNYPIILGQ